MPDRITPLAKQQELGGAPEVGPADEMMAKLRRLEAEHEAALAALGIPMVRPPFAKDPDEDDVELPPDLDEYDDLL